MLRTALNEVHIILIGRAAMAVTFLARHFAMIVELIFRHFDNAWFSFLVLPSPVRSDELPPIRCAFHFLFRDPSRFGVAVERERGRQTAKSVIQKWRPH